MENIISINPQLKEVPTPTNRDYDIMAAGLRKIRGIKMPNYKAQRQQADILIYLYKHPSLSGVHLRSLFRLSNITGWRQAGALRKAGLIRWKGSHKRGAYVITDEGKKFIEEKLVNKI